MDTTFEEIKKIKWIFEELSVQEDIKKSRAKIIFNYFEDKNTSKANKDKMCSFHFYRAFEDFYLFRAEIKHPKCKFTLDITEKKSSINFYLNENSEKPDISLTTELKNVRTYLFRIYHALRIFTFYVSGLSLNEMKDVLNLEIKLENAIGDRRG